jgi:hypothetical protein
MSALTPDQVLAVPAGELAAEPSEALFQLKNDAAVSGHIVNSDLW